jgi:hypothetical protein
MIGVGIPVGTGFGVPLGLVFDNLALGIAIGAGTGVVLGAAIDIRKRTRQWQDASQNQRIILIRLALLAVGLGLLVFNML